MDAEREVIDGSALAAQVEDADLGVGDTTVESRLGVGLEIDVLAYFTRLPSCAAVSTELSVIPIRTRHAREK